MNYETTIRADAAEGVNADYAAERAGVRPLGADWQHYFSRGPEIIDYIRTCYREMDIAGHMRFEEEVVSAVWDKARHRWNVTVRRQDGSTYSLETNAIVSGTGLLNRPSIPNIPGMDSFTGPMFHSSHWDHSVDLRGKNVALVGTGASGMQIGPQIAPLVGKLTVFQRSPHWARKNPLLFAEVTEGVKWGLANVPFYTKWYRFQLLYATSDGVLPSLKKDPEWHDPVHSLNAANAAIREQLIAHIRNEVNGDEELLATALWQAHAAR